MNQSMVSRLTLLLILQLLLVALVYSVRDGGPLPQAGALLTFDQAKIDRIEISSQESSVGLIRSDVGWQLAEDRFPADSGRVERLLDKLARLEGGVVVAESASARERLQVDDEQFERRITLYSGDDSVAELLVGSSAGMRRSHLRRPDDDAIYSAELPGWELAVEPHQWQDKGLLSFAVADLEKIDLPQAGSLLAQESDGEGGKRQWVASNSSDSPPDQQAVDSVTNQLANLRFDRVAEPSSATAIDLDALQFELTATIKGIGALDYRLYRFDGDPQRYLLQRSDHEQMFLLGETTAEGLIESVRLVDKGSSGA